MLGYALALLFAAGWTFAFARHLQFRNQMFREMEAMNERWHAIAVVTTLGAVREAIVKGRAWSLQDEADMAARRAALEQAGVNLSALGLDFLCEVRPPPESMH